MSDPMSEFEQAEADFYVEKNAKYYGEMDPECIRLCDAMNALPGILTTESCCGHGKKPYRISFLAKNLESLPRLLYYFDG